MATAYITPAKKTVSGVAHIPNPNEISDGFTLTAVADTTNGALIAGAFDGTTHEVTEELNEKHCFIILQNAGEADATVTFKAGDSYAACNDLTVTVKAGKYHQIVVDSAYFKVVNSSTGLGAIKIIPSASVNVAVLQTR